MVLVLNLISQKSSLHRQFLYTLYPIMFIDEVKATFRLILWDDINYNVPATGLWTYIGPHTAHYNLHPGESSLTPIVTAA